MLTIISSQNAATSALTAITVILGAMAFGGTAQAAEANPLLGDAAGATALNSEQMEGVEGSGRVANYYGKLGVDNAKRAYDTGYYARYRAATDSYNEYSSYERAANYANTAANQFYAAAQFSRRRL